MSSTAGRPGFAGRECAAHHGDAGEVDNHLTNIGHVRLEVFLPHIAYVAGLLVRGFHCRRAPELGINWFQPHQNPKGLLKQLRTGEGVSGHFRPGLSHEAPLGVRRPQLSALSATFAAACSVRSYMTSVWTSLRPLKARATQRGHSQCAAARDRPRGSRIRCSMSDIITWYGPRDGKKWHLMQPDVMKQNGRRRSVRRHGTHRWSIRHHSLARTPSPSNTYMKSCIPSGKG